jgi:hypothetical protein
MSKIIIDTEQLGDLVPFFMGLFIDNPELLSDEAEEFYFKIQKKIKSDLRKFIRSVPESRRRFKIIKPVFSGDKDNAVLTIRPDKSNESTKAKYLTESWQPATEICKKYLKE